MSTQDSESPFRNPSPDARLFDDHDFLSYKTVEDMKDDFCIVIFALAESYDGKELATLEQKTPWLQGFKLDLEKAKSAFIDDGNSFLQALDRFAELYHRELANAFLTARDTCYPLFLTRIYSDISNFFSAQSAFEELCGASILEKWKEAFQNDISNVDEAEMVFKNRALELVEWKPLFASYYLVNPDINIEYVRKLCAEVFDESKLERFFKNVHVACRIRKPQDVTGFAKQMDENTSIRACWLEFQTNIQNLVTHVASKKGSLSIDENLQTLRDINESRMHYVAMMQQTIQKLNKTVSDQQQVITALEFRYVLENIPGPAYAHVGTLAEKWRLFWNDVAAYYREREREREIEAKAKATKETAGREAGMVAEQGEEKKQAEDGKQKSSVENEAHPELDKLFGGRLKFKVENKGRDLYSDLSEIIHRYKGNTYEIEETHFGPVTSDVLKALTPGCFKNSEDNNQDGAQGTGNREVEWREEARRYSQFAKSRETKNKGDASSAEPEETKQVDKKKKKKKQKNTEGSDLVVRVKKLEEEVEKMLKCSGVVFEKEQGDDVQDSDEASSGDEYNILDGTSM